MTKIIQEYRTVRLYGVLGATFGRVHRLVIDTPREAIKALSVTIPGFERFLQTAKNRGLTFAVFNGKKNIDLDEIKFTGSEDIRIAPMIIGSKKAGIFQTILGAVIVAASAIGYYFAPGNPYSTYGFQIGGVMMLGGVVQMLSPMPNGLARREDPDNKPSYAFGGPVNTIAQGNPVPIGYGKRRVGGAIISAGIYAEDQQ
ncbi:Phage-related protein, tail component [Serratia entomophila]|jgi:predicted phage tail protein|uniref:tail assembly protein n=1 Tax=Serratia entomophila TaxID=42906 RepID=UPI001F30A131|nr:tail assembly protein [Serratia entomophila]UIW17000.1 tail assembly protein [Serratia entomophila]CAI0712987.1 Phage-related protein, tail component [Serratia entomophila]CAI0714281.1 Phage-related protein, tail component [Serratia entomophila]CAI0714848.1 Phage-related protein, tail component [Serratia entomophila]CAI0715141.1 Phage-related protein, tail component [Serratia entomophila]